MSSNQAASGCGALGDPLAQHPPRDRRQREADRDLAEARQREQPCVPRQRQAADERRAVQHGDAIDAPRLPRRPEQAGRPQSCAQIRTRSTPMAPRKRGSQRAHPSTVKSPSPRLPVRPKPGGRPRCRRPPGGTAASRRRWSARRGGRARGRRRRRPRRKNTGWSSSSMVRDLLGAPAACDRIALRFGRDRRRSLRPYPGGPARARPRRPRAPHQGPARRALRRPAHAPARPSDRRAVCTVLSQSTNDRNRDVAYLRLRERFPTWEAVRDAPVEEVEEAIRPGGISKVKSVRIQAILRASPSDRRALARLAPATRRVRGGARLPVLAARRRAQDGGVRPAVRLRACTTSRSTRTSRASARGSACSARARRSSELHDAMLAADAARRRAGAPRQPAAPRPAHVPCARGPPARAARCGACARAGSPESAVGACTRADTGAGTSAPGAVSHARKGAPS